jgi:hypothetical protein
VTEHRIRLRAGWTCARTGSGDGDHQKIALPISAPLTAGRRLSLSRSFGTPKCATGETIWLELRKVLGLESALLNGRPLPEADDGQLCCEIGTDWLAQRNLLVLEVELPLHGTDDGEWGEVRHRMETAQSE